MTWVLLTSTAICIASSSALACAPLSSALQQGVVRSARTFGLDQHLLSALLWTESHYCVGAQSPAGAVGLGQLMPRTAAQLGVDPYDPQQNIYGAAKYLRLMWDTFHDWTWAIAAYNAGPGAVQKFGGVPPYAETQAYVRKVLSAYPALAGTAGRQATVVTATKPTVDRAVAGGGPVIRTASARVAGRAAGGSSSVPVSTTRYVQTESTSRTLVMYRSAEHGGTPDAVPGPGSLKGALQKTVSPTALFVASR